MKIAAIAFTASALLAQQPQGSGVNLYSREKELALGRSLAAEMKRTSPPIGNPRAAAYVAGAGRRIAAVIGGGPEFSWEVITANGAGSHEPAGLPGGTVLVPASLIAASESEDEFAAMLAHAMAHSAERHGTRQATRGELAGAPAIPLIYMGGWTGFGQLGAILIPTGFAQFARKFELEADRLAALWTAEAGWDASALGRYLERTIEDDSRNQAMPTKRERLEGLSGAPSREPSLPSAFVEIRDELRAGRPAVNAPPKRKR